ncbi:MAG: hypothetical protein SOZ24_07860, partial [Treponema sp.]|nr:hypothetical protein [Treponema sp.]
NNIEMTVSYPFLLAMFGHELRKEITSLDVETTLKAIESYIFRRIMCPPLASFNAGALKLVILRVRDDAHVTACGRDWKGGLARSGA